MADALPGSFMAYNGISQRPARCVTQPQNCSPARHRRYGGLYPVTAAGSPCWSADRAALLRRRGGRLTWTATYVGERTDTKSRPDGRLRRRPMWSFPAVVPPSSAKQVLFVAAGVLQKVVDPVEQWFAAHRFVAAAAVGRGGRRREPVAGCGRRASG